MTEELLKIILLLSVGQGLTFSLLLLFKKKGDRRANCVLAMFIISVIIPLWNEYILSLPDTLHFLRFQTKLIYLPTLVGPLIYLYTLLYTKSKTPSKGVIGLLLVGPLLATGFLCWHYYFTSAGADKFTVYLFYLAVNTQIAGCLIASWFRLKQHNRDLKQNLSNIEQAKLDWLQNLLLGFALLLLIDFIQSSAKLLDLPIFNLMHILVSFSEGVFVFILGLFGLSKPEVLFEQVLVKAGRKYDNSSLSKDSANKLLMALNKLMKTEELYLDSDISLHSLSKNLDTTPHHLSQTLNQELGKSFYEFINFARIQRAQEMLANQDFHHLGIIDVAYQVGFNNKTSFNNAFKKHLQITPSQFRQQYKN